MNKTIPNSLKCPKCNTPMIFSHMYEDSVSPPSGSFAGGTAPVYSQDVDEFGYGIKKTYYVYTCPNCHCKTNSEMKYHG